jgi:hypothetical protein
MSFRGFGGIQTVTASAQPVYGTALTANAVINPDLFTGQIDTRGNRSSAVLSVTAGTAGRFRSNDRVIVGSAAQLEQGNTTQTDGGTVIAVNSTANTITVQGLQRSHSSGEFVVLAMTVSVINIQFISASGATYIGEDPTVGAASQTLLYQTTAAGTFLFGQGDIANALDTQKLWVDGVAGGQFIPAFITA